jgi:hypothetical protein
VPKVSRLFPRRLGPVGVALTIFDVYRRLPPKQRRQLLDLTLKHGSHVARAAYTRGRAARAVRRSK